MSDVIDWKKIKVKLEGWCPLLTFIVDGHTINVQKVNAGNLKHHLNVYIDGEINIGWDKESMPIVNKVWNKKVLRIHSLKERKEALERFQKSLGKREGKKFYNKMDMEKESIYYSPVFTSVTSFITTFKRIEGIKLLGEEDESHTHLTN